MIFVELRQREKYSPNEHMKQKKIDLLLALYFLIAKSEKCDIWVVTQRVVAEA